MSPAQHCEEVLRIIDEVLSVSAGVPARGLIAPVTSDVPRLGEQGTGASGASPVVAGRSGACQIR